MHLIFLILFLILLLYHFLCLLSSDLLGFIFLVMQLKMLINFLFNALALFF